MATPNATPCEPQSQSYSPWLVAQLRTPPDQLELETGQQGMFGGHSAACNYATISHQRYYCINAHCSGIMAKPIMGCYSPAMAVIPHFYTMGDANLLMAFFPFLVAVRWGLILISNGLTAESKYVDVFCTK